ncbi:glycosyl hydrolase family 18 protein [Aneurinibacillus tyrosinisolvens]|uniref:glycosyl hydrolase family 18 protein n=1 Tax=Aneurinibacillus tyrosinisolvens TaxID=1443435 RepID=UPI00063F560C|nr:LysM peptidoglycan-binding domain-containing protein [Aneurinibacillus tyrosinisolvens]
MGVYTVKRGDTLWGISQTFRLPIQTIRKINGLPGDSLVPGLALYLPQNELPEQFYQIQPGDTLWSIANRYRTRTNLIAAANPGTNPNQLTVGQRLSVPTPLKYSMESLGFLIPEEMDILHPIFPEVARQLSYTAIFSYTINADGTVNEPDDERAIRESKQNGVKPLMVLTNWTGSGFDPVRIGQVLQNPDTRRTLVRNISRAVQQKGYNGISVDFEFIPPERRPELSTFLRELKAAPGTGTLHINVPAKTKDDPANRLTGAFDYKTIGQIADLVAVMTIEYGYPQGPPNPIAPIWWVEQVVQYIVSQINRSKVMIALPFYGYNWPLPDTPATTASALAAGDAQNLAISKRVSIQYNWQAEAPFFQYTQGTQARIVWFEDVRSLRAKYRIMEVYRLRGATFWHLNYPFPQNWSYMQKNFRVIK